MTLTHTTFDYVAATNKLTPEQKEDILYEAVFLFQRGGHTIRVLDGLVKVIKVKP